MTPGVAAETDLAGTLKSEYIFFDGERVARRDGPTGAGGVFYYFSDHLKTASVITDAAGTIKAESDYYPWGGELQFVNNDTNDYKFTGKKRDTETGLDYFGARYYSNGLGRFITPDWAAKATAVPYAELADPQSLNLYTYVRNIPTTKYDADGHLIVQDDKKKPPAPPPPAPTPTPQPTPAAKKGGMIADPNRGSVVANPPCEVDCVQSAMQKAKAVVYDFLGIKEVDVPASGQATNSISDAPPVHFPMPFGMNWINDIANGHGFDKHVGDDLPKMSRAGAPQWDRWNCVFVA
jgi:RHS repeat-associated protein